VYDWKRTFTLLIPLLFLTTSLSGCLDIFNDEDDDEKANEPIELDIYWNEPVWLPRNPNCVDPNNGQEFPEYAIGYEPSIAVDSEGNLYYTAHKDLRWCAPGGGPLSGSPFPPLVCVPNYYTTWDYYASWFFVSQDGGETWGPPNDWGAGDYGSEYPGDEGDIGVDANDRVYFVDTTLEDNWLHVWDDGGDDYVMGKRLQSTSADDRPWLTAQGDGIVHYLGNNGVAITAPDGATGRYWYYRSGDGGLTFSLGKGLPGGWAHIAAERDGDHVYIVQEGTNGGGDIKVYVSEDTGQTWREPVFIGPLDGTHPEGYPWLGIGEDGTAFVAWQNSPQGGREPGTLYIARTDDYGVNWEYWDISAGHPHEEGGVFLYPNLEVGPGNLVAYTYYGNIGEHTAGDEWHLYAAALIDPKPGDIFSFNIADPFPLHTSSQQEADTDDLHPLHDLFEVVVNPVDLSINIAYQYNIGDHPFENGEEQRYLMFIKGEWLDIDLSSPAFGEGDSIPGIYTCSGDDISPPLEWEGLPEGTESLALTMIDPDASGSDWVHWLIWNMDPTRESLSKDVAREGEVLNGARQGTNDGGFIGYQGPCPPPDTGPHRYIFTLYALDQTLDLEAGATRTELEETMGGHILGKGRLMGTYQT